MRAASEWPAEPYPGTRPDESYVQIEDQVLPVTAGAMGFSVAGTDLDDWLSAHGAPSMRNRSPVLSYGSNACPSKLVTMRHRDGLRGPVVMTRCRVEGWAAAWCVGHRRDGAVPATLVAAPGTEEHFLWWVDDSQWPALDRCEGAPAVYELQPFPGLVHSTDGNAIAGVHAYVGVAANRLPRRDTSGKPVLVRDLDPELVQPKVWS